METKRGPVSIYEAIAYCRRTGGVKMTLRPLDEDEGGCALIEFHDEGKRLIKLNSYGTLEEQTQALIHELVHFSKQYRHFLETRAFRTPQHIEEAIEQETQRIYRENPVAVNFLRNKIAKLRGERWER